LAKIDIKKLAVGWCDLNKKWCLLNCYPKAVADSRKLGFNHLCGFCLFHFTSQRNSIFNSEGNVTKTKYRQNNIRTRRRMHLCMQDHQIGPKIVGFAKADMARLPIKF
jgi:hypothetical protein